MARRRRARTGHAERAYEQPCARNPPRYLRRVLGIVLTIKGDQHPGPADALRRRQRGRPRSSRAVHPLEQATKKLGARPGRRSRPFSHADRQICCQQPREAGQQALEAPRRQRRRPSWCAAFRPRPGTSDHSLHQPPNYEGDNGFFRCRSRPTWPARNCCLVAVAADAIDSNSVTSSRVSEREPSRVRFASHSGWRFCQSLPDPCCWAHRRAGGLIGVPVLDNYLGSLAARNRPNTVLAMAYDLKVLLYPFGPVSRRRRRNLTHAPTATAPPSRGNGIRPPDRGAAISEEGTR